jgi:hypothetical protein
LHASPKNQPRLPPKKATQANLLLPARLLLRLHLLHLLLRLPLRR